jgi:membrane-bound lytic murein transglycosylase B
MKKILIALIALSVLLQAKDYTKKPDVRRFIHEVSREYHIDRHTLKALFSHVREPRPVPPRKGHYAPPPKHGSWDRYSRFKVTSQRAKEGAAYILKHRKVFADAQKRYGIPQVYLAAIIGIETHYGRNVGKFHVFDRLAYLAFGRHRHRRFYRGELKHFLHLCKRQKINPRNVKGSSSGAIGLCQFIPSNYEAYGVDYNKDGRITLQRTGDAVMSVANYFSHNRWQKGEPVAVRVHYKGNRFYGLKTGYKHWYNRRDLKGIAPVVPWDYHKKVCLIKLDRKRYDELWYGAKNFFVITRYNHSSYYAMAVHQLAMRIDGELKRSGK